MAIAEESRDMMIAQMIGEESKGSKKALVGMVRLSWYGFSIFIPEDFQELDPSNTTLTQVKLVSFRQPLWDFNARGRYFSFEANASNQTCYAIKLDDMRGKWTDIALGIDYSTKKNFKRRYF